MSKMLGVLKITFAFTLFAYIVFAKFAGVVVGFGKSKITIIQVSESPFFFWLFLFLYLIGVLILLLFGYKDLVKSKNAS